MTVNVDDICNAISEVRSLRASSRLSMADAPSIVGDIISGAYKKKLCYKEMYKTNANGKRRRILCPDDYTLCLQHYCTKKMWELYAPIDPHVGLNCKSGCGISARRKRGCVARRIKHIYYDRRDLHFALVMDQRKCYDHMSRKSLRKALCSICDDGDMVELCVNVSFCGRTFPIGTPTSPMAHHVVMLAFDHFLRSLSGVAVRYADDIFAAFATHEEAQRAKWRIKNFWWYALGVRAKRHTVRIVPLTVPLDFCGIVFRRIEGRSVCDHDKGYALLRGSIAARAVRSRRKSWPSYFGLLRAVDGFRLMECIEDKMNLQTLTDKVRINRALDAPTITVKELADEEIEFAVHDYDIKCDKAGVPNWIKCLVSYPAKEANGRRVMREFHGNYQGIISFHLLCERAFGKSTVLPMTRMRIILQCGYIYEGSSNMLTEIDDDESLNT